MTTFFTEDRLICELEILQKISNDHLKTLSDVVHRKPLTVEQAWDCFVEAGKPNVSGKEFRWIVKAIEKAHKIL